MIVDIPSLKKHLLNGRINSNDIIPILSVIRVEIETKKLQEKYQFLNMFCNWCVHPKLSGTMLSIEIMQQFMTALNDYDIKGFQGIANFNKYIIDNFFGELRTFFNSCNIPSFPLLKDTVFLQWFLYILNVIKGRGLLIPEQKFIEKNESRKQKYQVFVNLCNTSLGNKGGTITPTKLHIVQEENGFLRWQLDTLEFIDYSFEIGYDKKRLIIPKD